MENYVIALCEDENKEPTKVVKTKAERIRGKGKINASKSKKQAY